MKNITFKKIMFSLVGVVLISIAVSLFRLADIGTDPFSCFNLGIANVFGLSFGTAQLRTNIVLSILLLYPGLKYFGVGTILAMVLVGYISDFVLFILPFDGSGFSLLLRVVIVLVGIATTSTGISMYSCANLGISQYDMMGFLLSDTGLLRLSYARVIVDVALVVSGFFMGSVVGIGTVLIAFLVGPAVSWLIPNLIAPLVAEK